MLSLARLIGLAIVLFESRLRRVSLKRLIGAAVGSVLGILGAYLFAPGHPQQHSRGHTQSFLQILVMLLMAYVGLVVGANKGDLLNLAALGGSSAARSKARRATRFSTPASSSMAASRTLPRPDFWTASS